MKRAIIFVLLLLVLAGCSLPGQQQAGQAAKKFLGGVINKSTGGRLNVSDDGEEVSLQTEEGEMKIKQDDLITDFPTDMPVYPGASVQTSWVATEKQGGIMAEFVTTDQLDKIERFYRDQLAENGWYQTNELAQAGSVVFSAEKDERSAWVSLNQNENQVLITILVVTNNE
jgi:hypothetical protein